MTQEKKEKKIKRDDLIKRRGHMVTILYRENGSDCFAIGWFFQLTLDMARLKVTSTRFETYESLDIPIDQITKIEEYRD